MANDEKKPTPASSKLLDAGARAIGLYKPVPAPTNVEYQIDWFLSPLGKSKESLGQTAQKPILDALKAVLILDPPTTTASPWMFRLHKSLPVWIRATETPKAAGAAYDGPLVIDLVTKIPAPDLPTNSPNSPTTPPVQEKKYPQFEGYARLVKLVVGGTTVAELQNPVEIGLRLRLAERPAQVTADASSIPILAAMGLRFQTGTPAELTLELTDSSHLCSAGPSTASEQAATRSIVWKTGESLVAPLVKSTLLVLRAWLVQLCKKNAQNLEHFSWRIHNHLLPLLEGSGNGVLPAFPFEALKPDPAALKPWLQKFVNPQAIMTVLCHLRGLLTGKSPEATAPGSAIAWFADPDAANPRTDYTKPLPNDFGLVIHQHGDVESGSASLGLRGQACWENSAKTIRAGLAIEGELLQGSWSFVLNPPTTTKASIKASTGEVAVFVVLEPIEPETTLVTVQLDNASVVLKRVEVGVRLRLGVVVPTVKVTQTNNVVQWFEQASQKAIATLNALASMIPPEVRTAIASQNPGALMNAVIQWAKEQLQTVATQSLQIPLGNFAMLKLDSSMVGNDVTAGVSLTMSPNSLSGPIQLANNTAFNLSVNSAGVIGVGLSIGVQTGSNLGLPAPIAVLATLVGTAPKLELKYGQSAFDLLNPVVAANDVATKVLQPMLDGLITTLRSEVITQGVTIGQILDLIGLKTTGFGPPTPEQVLEQILSLLSIASPMTVPSPTALPPMLKLVSGLEFADDEVALSVGEINVGIFDNGVIKPSLEIANVELKPVGVPGKPLYGNDWFSIGKLGMSMRGRVEAPMLQRIALQVHDIRLPLGSAGSGDAGLMSTGKENPGLGIELSYENVGTSQFNAKFLNGQQTLQMVIDRVIGPIDVQRIRASLDGTGEATNAKLVFDAEFKLGGVRIAPYGLGVQIPLNNLGDPSKWSATLDGLALSYQATGMSLSGMLARTTNGFVGQAAMDAFGFQLGALAAYEKLEPDKVASLVIFAVLDAMLGGPPFFVVTGVAAGFGVNRAFERPARTEDLRKNPLLATMQGSGMDLNTFRTSLPGKPGAYWFAAGVRFVSYGFIKGNALLYVLFDDGFELGVIALAKMEIPALALIQLAVEAGLSTRGEPTLYAKAALYDSWLLHEDCKLTGGFALQIWPEKGDAVITLGGYHPRFAKPKHYPDVDRIGFRWALGSAISIKGACYFALTPRAAMGGGRLEVEGTWGPLSAGFHAAVDGLIQWDPFYFDVSIEVGVWMAINTWLGRLRMSLGVALHVWGPPVGGIATIDITVITIQVPFGVQAAPKKAALPVGRVFREHLQIALPVGIGDDASGVHWSALNLLGADPKAPLRLSVVSGQVAKPVTAPNNGPTRLQLGSEFKIRVESAIPLTIVRLEGTDTPIPDANAPLYLTLAKQSIAKSALILNRSGSANAGLVEPQYHERPMALFGPYDAAGTDSSEQTCEVTVEAIWDMTATFSPAILVDKLAAEYSTAAERCPLPLARNESVQFATASATRGVPTLWTSSALQSVAPELVAERAANGRPLPRRTVSLSRIDLARTANFYRSMSHARLRTRQSHPVEPPPQLIELAFLELPKTTTLWAGRTRVPDEYGQLPRVAPPVAVRRSLLLDGVELHVVEPQLRNERPIVPRAPFRTLLTMNGLVPRSAKPPAGPARRKPLVIDAHAFSGASTPLDAELPTGEVCVLDLAASGARRIPSWRLLATSGQRVRVVALDGVNKALDDVDVLPGIVDQPLPAGTRRVALFGLGAEEPLPIAFEPEPQVWGSPPESMVPTLPATAPIGFGASTSLVGVGACTFVGPGCVVELVEGSPPSRAPLGVIGVSTASKLLGNARRVEVRLRGQLGLIGVHVQALGKQADPRAVVCLVNGQQEPVQRFMLRGNAIYLVLNAPLSVANVSVIVPEFVRLVGVSRWPGWSEVPANVFDVPIHHVVRRRADATTFRLEVLS